MTDTAALPRGYDGVAVCAPFTVPYSRTTIRTTQWWLGKALAGLIDTAGIAKDEIDGLVMGSYSLGADHAVTMTEYLGLSVRWLDDLKMGGASGAVAIRRAARAVEAGDAEVVACMSGDAVFGQGFRDLIENFSGFSRDAVLPYGAGGPNQVFALLTRRYMAEHGATREDFGKICITQRAHAAENPAALLRSTLTMEAYLAARPIADPLHLFDCVLPCCGAEAFLVTTVERAKALGLPYAEVHATAERHNAYPDDPVQLRGGWPLETDRLYGAANAGPGDMDFLQAYDDYPVIVTMQMEDLGFCAKGDGPAFLRDTDFSATGGGLPLNTNGGQLSVGQAGAAGGFLGTVEAIRQITGQTLGASVPDVRLGMISGYGTVNYDRGLCASAAILGKPGS